ncbi:hypothetical protein V2J09_021013 [Rumex salicifolius]
MADSKNSELFNSLEYCYQKNIKNSSFSPMEFWILLLPAPLLFFLLTLRQNRNRNLPPSPSFSLPVLGHLHLISQPVRYSLYRLSLSLGPIFSLRFGSRLVVVISSASAAEDCFSQNDVALANRPGLLSGLIVGYNFSTIVNSPYGPRWRSLRKSCTAQIFSPFRLNFISRVWSNAVENLIWKIVHKNSNSNSNSNSKVVVLRPLVKEMMFEILMMILAGERAELGTVMETIQDVLKHSDAANPADFVPFMKWIDFRGYQKSLKRIFSKVDGLLQGILDERRRKCENGGRKDVLIDNLLELQQSGDDFYDDELIKGLLLFS